LLDGVQSPRICCCAGRRVLIGGEDDALFDSAGKAAGMAKI
jgi:hypothetical protein